jgi:hypothetical protein
VNFSSLNGSGNAPAGEQYIVFKQNTRSGNFEGFFLGKARNASGDFFVFNVSSAAGVSVEVDSTPTIQTGVWYHVAGVRGTNFLQLYVNGQLVGQASVTFPQDYGNFPLYFGTSGQTYWDRKFAGLLDEVSLYNRALSPGEIASIYSAGAAGKCRGGNGPLVVSQTPDPTEKAIAESANYAGRSSELQTAVVPLVTAQPPSIQSVVLKNGAAVITWGAIAGRIYQVQFSDNLQSNVWNNLQPDVLARGSTASTVDRTGSVSQRFYRVLTVQ